MNKNKKIGISILTAIAVSSGALGLAVSSLFDLPNAQAEAVTMTLDTLGDLTWNEVDGATGYNWSYSINDSTTVVDGGSSTTNSANVKTALKAAADEAKALNTDADDSNNVTQATVSFSVTPVLADGSDGTVQTWTKTFTQYIDYGYTTTDISEYMTEEETTLRNVNTVAANAKFFKNDIFTFSMCSTSTDATNPALYQIAVGGTGGLGNNLTSNYRFQLDADCGGTWQIAVKDANKFGGEALLNNTTYYYSIAVFDTYNLVGTSLGETVYLGISTLDSNAKRFVKYFEQQFLFETSVIEDADVTAEELEADSTLQDYYYGWNESGDVIKFRAYTAAHGDLNTISTGDLSKILSKQAGLAVDKLGNLSWDAIENATGYQWSYTVGNATSETFVTETNSANVNEALKAAAEVATTAGESEASISFTITPVLTVGTGTPLVYDYSFTKYYGYNGKTQDISKYMLVAETAISGRAANIVDPVIYKNTSFTWGVRADLVSYGQGIYQIGIGGSGSEGASRYFFRLRVGATGTGWQVRVGGNSYQTNSPHAIEVGKEHYFSLSICDTYNLSGAVIGETIYLMQSEYDETTGKLIKVAEEAWTFDSTTIDSAVNAVTAYDCNWTQATNEENETVCYASIGFGMYQNDPNATYTDGTTGNGYTRIYLFSGDPTWQPDTEENGLTFDMKDFYEIGTLESAPNTIEVELMVPESFNDTTKAGVIVSNEVGGYGITLDVYNYGCPSLSFEAPDGTGYRVRFSKIDLSKGYWVHLTITHDKENNVINGYLNGKFIEAGAVKYSSDLSDVGATYFDYAEDITNAPFFLGNTYEQTRGDYFQGSIRSIAMYSDVRTADEIAQDYLSGIDTTDNQLLVAYETPNTAAGANISDLSMNGQTLDYYHWDDLFFTEKEAVTDYEYSFAVVGDIQSVTQRDTNQGWTYLDGLYDWIIDNKDSKNIQYVFNLGDTTERNTDGEWATAKAAISQMDGVIPYSLIRGNHDSSEQLNATFYYDAYTNQFNGFFEEGKLDNSWRTFTVGETNYLMVNLDYSPTDEVLAWAAEIIEAFPEHKVIITTHSYLSSRGTLSTGSVGLDYNFEGNYPPEDYDADNNGEEMWEKLVSKHGNIFLVLSGHVTAQRKVMTQLTGVHGNTVTQILVDPQSWDGNFNATGMVVMLYFKNNGTIEVEEYSTAKQAYFREENQYTINELSPVYTAHNFGEWVQNGNEQTRTCEDCGHTETQSAPEADESKVKAITLTLDGTIGVNFYVSLASEVQENIANAKLKIVCNGNEQILDSPEAQVGVWSDGLYKFTYHVAAKEIDTAISVQLMIDGELVGKASTYTVRDYINIVLADDSGAYTEKHKALVTALQDYCEAAAVFHNVENAAITDDSRINAVADTVFDSYGASVEGENAPKIAISLLTEATTTIRVYVMGAEAPTITVNGTELTVTAGDGYYYADVTGIDAFSLETVQTITINGTIQVSCSALTYGKVMDTSNSDLVNVMKALYLYSQAATAYRA